MILAGISQISWYCVNKSFKDHLRKKINNYIKNKMVKNQRGHFVKLNLNEVVKWLKNVSDKITKECIANALRVGYLDKKYSFMETSIARHKT